MRNSKSASDSQVADETLLTCSGSTPEAIWPQPAVDHDAPSSMTHSASGGQPIAAEPVLRIWPRRPAQAAASSRR